MNGRVVIEPGYDRGDASLGYRTRRTAEQFVTADCEVVRLLARVLSNEVQSA